jgi:NitT/TauT family transport system ATP-binding protein
MAETPASSAISIRNLCFTFRDAATPDRSVEVLRNFSLAVQDGEVVCLFGPNGCGKSTLIRLCAGILAPTSGEIAVLGAPPERSTVGYVPQKFSESLFPWLTALDNIAFPSAMNGRSRREARELARETALKIAKSPPLDRHPFELSIGQQQLVALARAIVRSPRVLLADEPFSALDFQARMDLHQVFQNVLRPEYGGSALLASHDVEDAVFLGDRVMVCSPAPMLIVRTFGVPFPRPRPEEFRRSREFVDLVAEITDEFLRWQST